MTLRLLLVHQLHPGTWGPPKASSTVAPRMSLHPEKGSDEGRWRGPHAVPCKPAQLLPLPRRGRLGVSPDSASPAKVTAMHIHCRAVRPADFLQTTVPIRLTDDISPERLSHLPRVTQQVQLRLKPRARRVGRGRGAWGGALVPMGMRCPPSQSLAGAGPKLRGPGPHDEQGCPPRVLSVGAAWRAGGTCVRPGVSRQRGVCSEEPAPGPQHRLMPAGGDQAGGWGRGAGVTRGGGPGREGSPWGGRHAQGGQVAGPGQGRAWGWSPQVRRPRLACRAGRQVRWEGHRAEVCLGGL